MYQKVFKRFIDIVISGITLIILAVPMLIIAVVVKCSSRGPALFWQKRVGRYKETFMMPKFRSMYTETPPEVPTHMLENPDQYITRVGKFLRAHSLDELPQIWDIFIGNMSVIGERGIIETTKNNADFSRVVTVNSISL